MRPSGLAAKPLLPYCRLRQSMLLSKRILQENLSKQVVSIDCVFYPRLQLSSMYVIIDIFINNNTYMFSYINIQTNEHFKMFVSRRPINIIGRQIAGLCPAKCRFEMFIGLIFAIFMIFTLILGRRRIHFGLSTCI